MTKRQDAVYSALFLAALALAMLVTQRLSFRLDLTEGKAFTLAPASKRLYAEIPERVLITYFVSERLARTLPAPGEIEDLLRSFVAHSRGRISLVVQDPETAGTVAAAQRLGVEGQQIQIMSKGEAGVATVYSGIVLEYLDRTATIPAVLSLDTLEYDITSRIRSLVKGREREIGIMAASEDAAWPDDFPFVARALSAAGYGVRAVSVGAAVPDAVSALFVFGGASGLDDWDLYRIDRYVRSGGRVLFAAEGVEVDARSDLRATPVGPSPLLDLLSAYGVRVERQLALDRAALALPYQVRTPDGATAVRLIRYPFWIGLLRRYADPSHPVTARFPGLDLYWASPLSVRPPAGVDARVLATTTEDGWRMTGNYRTDPAEADRLFAENPGTTGRAPLVVALSGTFPSPYYGRPKPTRTGSPESLPDLPAESAPARILAVGDADFATALIQYSRSDRNLDFLIAAADWLGGDDDLIALRTRGRGDERLDAIADAAEREGVAARAQILNVLLIPGAVLAFALLRAARRRKKEDHGVSG